MSTDIRTAIQQAMQARGLSVYKLARLAGLNIQTVTAALKSESMTTRVAERLMGVLDLEISERGTIPRKACKSGKT